MSSVVALLLTDVEGSTTLWQDRAEAMDAAMVAHHELVAWVVAGHGGWLPPDQGEGDARLAAFPTATAAVAAAVGIQQGLVAAEWPGPLRLSVRMGLHVGEVLERDGNYFGETINRCARIRGLAAGGQVLASEATAQLVAGRLPVGVSLRVLGEHPLKGLHRPELIHQVCVEGLGQDFPPIATTSAPDHNLPVRLTSFIGREREIRELLELLDGDARLITLLGPGGVGKTRLAEQVCRRAASSTRPVTFVDLSLVTAAEEVAVRIAEALHVNDLGVGPLASIIQDLANAELIVVLDNCEHVLPAASDIAALVGGCPGMRVLATSRAPLGVAGEKEWPVDALNEDSVALFCERASVVRSALSDDDVSAAREICIGLDHLPLAIELVAAQCRTLPPRSLLPRLKQALGRAPAGERPSRHHTMREVVQWSVDALPGGVARLLSMMAVFSGPVTLVDIEALFGESVDDVWGGVDDLVRHSLLTVSHDDDPRFGMLVIVRDYALDSLRALPAADTDAFRRRHAEHFTAKARHVVETATGFIGPTQLLGADYAEYAAALSYWSDPDEIDRQLALANALFAYWWNGNRPRDAAMWYARILAQAPESEGRVFAAAQLLFVRSSLGPPDQDDLAAYVSERAETSRELHDVACHSLATYHGLARLRSRQGAEIAEQGLMENLRQGGSHPGDAETEWLATLSIWAGSLRYAEHARVRAELERMAAYPDIETGEVGVLIRGLLGSVLTDVGQIDQALPLLDQACELLTDSTYGLWARTWRNVAWYAAGHTDRVEDAVEHELDSLTGQESMFSLTMLLPLAMHLRIRSGNIDGARAILDRLDEDALTVGYGLPVAAMGARARRLAGDASAATHLRNLCAARLPLDEARPEVITYWHEVAATETNPDAADRARAHAAEILDAAGLVMPTWEQETLRTAR